MRGQGKEKQRNDKYALGTGSVLYDVAEYDELRLWMVSQGAVPPETFVSSPVKEAPTIEEIDRRQMAYAAKSIQRHTREHQRKSVVAPSLEEASASGKESLVKVESDDDSYGEGDNDSEAERWRNGRV
jgi:hypothetical protein